MRKHKDKDLIASTKEDVVNKLKRKTCILYFKAIGIIQKKNTDI